MGSYSKTVPFNKAEFPYKEELFWYPNDPKELWWKELPDFNELSKDIGK